MNNIAIRITAIIVYLSVHQVAQADQWYLADGQAWPGRLQIESSRHAETMLTRPQKLPRTLVPRVQSLEVIEGGRLVFCSGLDQAILEATTAREREFLFTTGCVRQLRADSRGNLYWSVLQTPLEGSPLPNGSIYRRLASSGEVELVTTIHQDEVQRDWWGAFDIFRDEVYIATLGGRTRIYNVSQSPPRFVARLPISIRSFRLRSPLSIDCCDGQGKLYRYFDLRDTARYDVILATTTKFVDFRGVK